MKTPILNILVDGKYVSVPAIKGTDGHTPVRGTDYWTEADKTEITGYIDNVIQDVKDNKVDNPEITTEPDDVINSTYEFSSKSNTIYRYSALAMETLSFTFSNEVYDDDYTAELAFNSGDIPPTISYSNSGILNWLGTDCSLVDGLSIFAPTANKHYDIVFYFNGTCFVGLVNGFEMATINNKEIENREA